MLIKSFIIAFTFSIFALRLASLGIIDLALSFLISLDNKFLISLSSLSSILLTILNIFIGFSFFCKYALALFKNSNVFIFGFLIFSLGF